jgi:hypothetical protein
MPEENIQDQNLQDNSTPPPPEPLDGGQGGDVPTGDDAPVFDEAQQQYLKSWMGRVRKEITDEVKGSIPTEPQHAPPQDPPPQDDLRAIDQFNEKLQGMIFEGNVIGAMQEANRVLTTAQNNLVDNRTTRVRQELTKFSDKPYYKDVFQDAEKIAIETANGGIAPEQAVEYAYTKAVNALLMSGSDTGGLTFESGGRRTTPTKTPKLPPQFQAAAKRDIARGLFKDEAEYIASLSPQIRKQLGI